MQHAPVTNNFCSLFPFIGHGNTLLGEWRKRLKLQPKCIAPGSNRQTNLPKNTKFTGDDRIIDVYKRQGWQHRLTGFDYLYRYTDVNLNTNPYAYDDFLADEYDHINRVGFEYQGDYSERTWAHSTFGYRMENENGVVGDLLYPPSTSGQRLSQDAYLQQQLTLGRLSVIAGGRFVHNSLYGNTGVPRIALTLRALRGGELFSGTRLRFSYATGFMEPALYQTFASLPNYIPNPGLLPERTRAFEAGFQQKFLAGRWALDATYFNNLFHDQIEAAPNQEPYQGFPPDSLYQFFNVQQSFAQGAEVQLQGRIRTRWLLDTAYTLSLIHIYCSNQHFRSLKCSSVCASLPHSRDKDREAGVIPALPRNCKRENRSRSLGAIPGRPSAESGCSVRRNC